jgi:hypothetical protein
MKELLQKRRKPGTGSFTIAPPDLTKVGVPQVVKALNEGDDGQYRFFLAKVAAGDASSERRLRALGLLEANEGAKAGPNIVKSVDHGEFRRHLERVAASDRNRGRRAWALELLDRRGVVSVGR